MKVEIYQMNDEQKRNIAFTYFGMLLVLVLAYIFDLWREYTSHKLFLENSGNLYGYYWSYVVTTIILSLTIVYWIWMVHEKVILKKWIYITLIIPSLILIIYPIIFYTPQGLPYWIYRLAPASQSYLASGIIIIVGILKIINRKK